MSTYIIKAGSAGWLKRGGGTTRTKSMRRAFNLKATAMKAATMLRKKMKGVSIIKLAKRPAGTRKSTRKGATRMTKIRTIICTKKK